jgi:alpha-tubulin suppressor-like RCC1 family protein
MYITQEGHLYASGCNNFGQLGLEDNTDSNICEKVLENTVAVSCGSCHTMYITQEGVLYASGSNHLGQIVS